MPGVQLNTTQPQADGKESFHFAINYKHHWFLLTVLVLCACASWHLDLAGYCRYGLTSSQSLTLLSSIQCEPVSLLMADLIHSCVTSSMLASSAVQGTTIERCVAVAGNPALFNIYNTAAALILQHAGQAMYKDPIMYRAEACTKIMMPEHAELTANMDPAVSNFLTAVKHIVDMLAWLNNPANVNTGTLLQLSQLATAMAEMDGYSGDVITVMLIEARSQLDQCSDFLTFLGSHSAMQLSPVAQIAAEMRTVVALQDQATAQQIQQALTRSQALFSSPKNESFVRHFATRDSALFDAYLQQSWQHQIDLLLQPGKCLSRLDCDAPQSNSPSCTVLLSAQC